MASKVSQYIMAYRKITFLFMAYRRRATHIYISVYDKYKGPLFQAPRQVYGRHSMLSFLSSIPISVLRILDTEANKFYDRNHQLYDAALVTRCYTQHALRQFIDSETNHKRHFIKIPFIKK